MESIINYIKNYLLHLDTTTIVTGSIIVIFAIALILLEKKFPYTKGQKLLREGFFNDLVLYTIVQSYVLGLVIGELIKFIDGQTGIQRYQLLSDVPVWIIVLGSLFFHDFYIYWFHRWMHNNKYLWRLHEAHHSTKEVDWLSGSRSHALEILINQTVEFAPFILLGAPAEAAIIKGCISAVWGMWIHANLDIHTGKLHYIINGPEMHRWHHSDKHEEAYNTNYATKFAFWDYLFGSAFFPEDEKPKYYGLSEFFPSNYVKQFFFAFRKMKSEG